MSLVVKEILKILKTPSDQVKEIVPRIKIEYPLRCEAGSKEK